jgi:peptidoglycan/xylan/chitin deacetylase (PgdA/CDA1 family)
MNDDVIVIDPIYGVKKLSEYNRVYEIRPFRVFSDDEPEEIINVSNGNYPKKRIPEDSKKVALTFDDGPSGKYTEEILDILKAYNVKATFFVMGEKIEHKEHLIRRLVNEGHEIGNHTWEHCSLTHGFDDDCFYSIEKTNKEIENICGTKPTALRPPSGIITRSKIEIVNNMGLSLVGWDIDSNDWRIREKTAIKETIISELHGGDTILLHDVYKETVDAIKIILPELIQAGYQMVTISEFT